MKTGLWALHVFHSVFFCPLLCINAALEGLFVRGVTTSRPQPRFVYRVGNLWSRCGFKSTGSGGVVS